MAGKIGPKDVHLENIDVDEVSCQELHQAIVWRVTDIKQSLTNICVLADLPDFRTNRVIVLNTAKEVAALLLQVQELEQKLAQ